MLQDGKMWHAISWVYKTRRKHLVYPILFLRHVYIHAKNLEEPLQSYNDSCSDKINQKFSEENTITCH